MHRDHRRGPGILRRSRPAQPGNRQVDRHPALHQLGHCLERPHDCGGQWRSGTVYGESQAQLATALVMVLASVLSEQYAVTSTRSEVRLTVEGITEIQDYAEVSRYLEGLTQVMSVQPIRILTDMVEFKLRSEGEVQQIIDVIALDRKLTLLRLDESSSTLWYRWTP